MRISGFLHILYPQTLNPFNLYDQHMANKLFASRSTRRDMYKILSNIKYSQIFH